MQYVSRSTTIELNATPDAALLLFTAAGEREWVPGWDPIYIYPETGEPGTGMIWKTEAHDQEAIWVTINHDTEQHTAAYVKWTPEKHVTRIDVQCDPAPDGKTVARVTYTLTALSEQGGADIEKLTEDHYNEWIASWEKAINHYLATGESVG